MPQFNSGAAEQIGRFSEGLLLRLLHRSVIRPRHTSHPGATLRSGVKTRKCTLCPSCANEGTTLPLPVRFIVLGRSQRLYKALIFKGSALVAASRKFGP